MSDPPPPVSTAVSPAEPRSGVELIAAERQRQIDAEGWTPDHDDWHAQGELALAAICYALPPRIRTPHVRLLWPWKWDWWKPSSKDRIRELTKAGALIAAEIDRLQRKSSDGR